MFVEKNIYTNNNIIKHLELNVLGVQKMETVEMRKLNGGGPNALFIGV